MEPDQLAAAYGVLPLWQDGYKGAGQGVALIEVAHGLAANGVDDPSFTQLSNCFGPYPTPKEDQVLRSPGGQDAPIQGGEGVIDPMVVAAIAPAAQIYVFESGASENDPRTVQPKLLAAALNARNTGGKLVAAILISQEQCEAAWKPAQVNAEQAELRRAASLGVAVFQAAGDGGSVGTYTPINSTPYCAGWPIDTAAAKQMPGAFGLGLQYPASSPLVTSVGGTELVINGVVPPTAVGDDTAGARGAPAGGAITNEIVWNQDYLFPPPGFGAGGGGRSELFTVADAPWERDVGLSGHEEKPDIAALAGSPEYLQGYLGTSGAGPLMAGAVAVLDSYLAGHHAKPTGPLNPTLYHIAADPAVSPTVFNEISEGTNDLLGLGCCTATAAHRYNMAGGLGSLNIAGLGAALLADPRLRVPWTTLKLTATPANATIGTPLTITAVTNNVIVGTPYRINIYLHGKLFATCTRASAGVCQENLYPTPPLPVTYKIEADVGPAGVQPFSVQAIVSTKLKVTVDRTRPTACKRGTCS